MTTDHTPIPAMNPGHPLYAHPDHYRRLVIAGRAAVEAKAKNHRLVHTAHTYEIDRIVQELADFGAVRDPRDGAKFDSAAMAAAVKFANLGA